MTTQGLLQGLWFAVDEVIHHDDIEVGRFQDAITRGDSHHENVGCVKCYSQERKPSAMVGSGEHVSTKQEVPVNIKVFDLRTTRSSFTSVNTAPNPLTAAACVVPGMKNRFSVIVLSKAVKSLWGLNVLNSAG